MAKYEQIEVMPGVIANEKHVSWFVSRMFNPEDNVWVWIRRISNILTFVILIIVIWLLITVMNLPVPAPAVTPLGS